MSEKELLCFVIMPFEPELYYFYLYIKQHIQSRRPGFRCERADAQYLSKPIPDKINEYLQKADVMIADCSGSNANVFYEIGLAHALNRKVILIASDSETPIPFNLSHHEIIRYKLDEHIGFLDSLDKALNNVLSPKYEWLYEAAKDLFVRFKRSAPSIGEMTSKEEFISRVQRVEHSRYLQAVEKDKEFAHFALPMIVLESDKPVIMRQIVSWLKTYKRPKKRTQ